MKHTLDLSTAEGFAAGYHILAKQGADLVTKNILVRMRTVVAMEETPDRYLVGKLAYALDRLPENADAAPATPAKKTPPIADAVPDAPATVGTSPRAKALHKQHAHTHALLVTAETDEQRAEHATAIMENIVPALDAEYDRLRAAGDTPQPEEEIAVAPILTDDSAAQLRKLQSIRTRISTIRKHLATAQGKRRADLEKELALKTAEKARLEELLA